jgi:8-oxo-dGTP diphosphatase
VPARILLPSWRLFFMAISSTSRLTKVSGVPLSVKVTAGILRRSGRILITQRGPDDRHPLKWEFPGGKIEAGETPQACLRRELDEELGIRVRVGGMLVRHLHREDQCQIDLLAFRVHWVAGQIGLKVHSQCRWVTAAALSGFDFLPADRPIIAHLTQAAGEFSG